MAEAWRRRLSLYVRFARYLLHEFRWPLTIFAVLVAGGGALLKATYHKPALTYAQACYAVFMMVFGEQAMQFPAEWDLQLTHQGGFHDLPLL